MSNLRWPLWSDEWERQWRRSPSRYDRRPVPSDLADRVVTLAELLRYAHPQRYCTPPCVIHAPSPHPLVTAPLYLGQTWLLLRVCNHEVRHPDPDSLAFLDPDGRRGHAAHECDGCCRRA